MSLPSMLTEIRSCCFGDDRIESDREDGVIQLIVDLHTVDSHVQGGIAHGPSVFNPQTIERLSFGCFLLAFGID